MSKYLSPGYYTRPGRSARKTGDVRLPLEGSTIPQGPRTATKSPAKPRQVGKEIGEGFKRLRELTKGSRSPSKR